MHEELLQRLEAKTIKVGDCWLYQAAQTKKGYCQIQFNGKQIYLHRLSAHIHWGFDLDSPMQILHHVLCMSPNCWNPKHLREGTNKENVMDSVLTSTHKNAVAEERKMRTHCPQGHPYDEENTYIHPDGSRACKTCNREKARMRYYAR